jgi:hypothetical protein
MQEEFLKIAGKQTDMCGWKPPGPASHHPENFAKAFARAAHPVAFLQDVCRKVFGDRTLQAPIWRRFVTFFVGR